MLKSHEYPLTFTWAHAYTCLMLLIRLAGPASPTDLIGDQNHGRFGFSSRLDMHQLKSKPN